MKIEIKPCNDIGLIIESLGEGLVGVGELMQVTQSCSISPDNQNKIGGMLQVVGQVISSAAKAQSLADIKAAAKKSRN